jgi:uncharacterized membrane protein YphA (DoxX/SURF4 family)
MSTTSVIGDHRHEIASTSTGVRGDAVEQAYRILHAGFVVAPIVAGADKFFNLLTDWTQYLAPAIPRTLGVDPSTFMMIVGAIEIVAGLLVLVKPRIGGLVVATWLVGIIINLLMIPGYFDVALRDLGLALGALALSRLAAAHAR